MVRTHYRLGSTALTDAGRAVRFNAISSVFWCWSVCLRKSNIKWVLVDYWPIKDEFSPVVCLIDLRFDISPIVYGHVDTVSSPKHTFPWQA